MSIGGRDALRPGRLLLVVAFVLAARAGGKEILRNGEIKGPLGWSHTPGAPTVTFKLDRKNGAKKRGSLYLANTNAQDRTAHHWTMRFDVPKGEGYRLKLSVSIRTAGMKPGAAANAMVQVRPKDGDPVLNYAWCAEVTEDTDWRRTHAVFEVPENAHYVLIMAYLVGAGKVWFDDFSVVKTKEPVTAGPVSGGGDDKYWKLARSCAREIPWLFDTVEALTRARKERRRVLVYVRSTDDKEGLASAQTTLDAAQVRNTDDGYRKDILFRAGPLSDPDVAELIERRFVPLLLTYHFGSHGQGQEGRMDWLRTKGRATLAIDEKEGALFIRNTNAGDPMEHAWLQMLRLPAGRAHRVTLKARIRTKRMGKGAEAGVQLNCWGDNGADLGTERAGPVRKASKWRGVEAEMEVPKNFRQLRLFAYLRGKGEVWIDDISVKDAAGKEYVFNGEADPRKGADPMADFDLKGSDAGTPALLVVDGKGKLVSRLHRIGTLSTDLVDRWLRARCDDKDLPKILRTTAKKKDARSRIERARALIRLGDLDAAGEILEHLDTQPARYAIGLLHLRRGDWATAREAFAGASPSNAAAFWQAWCMHRLGAQAEAAVIWKKLAEAKKPDRWSRKAAACLLKTGPRLWLSASERLWPRGSPLGEETEGVAPEGFDPVESVTLLLEFQNEDGSFGTHSGAPGFGVWDAAVTAFSAEALERWLDHLPEGMPRRVAAARKRAIDYLAAWSKRRNARSDAFNNPYVLMYLVRAGEKEIGAKVIERIAASQNDDGNWSVYPPERPASFNTALAVMALAKAEAAGWEVPRDVLESGTRALAEMRQPGELFPYSTKPGHEWMTTEHGSIARDALCEHTLLLSGQGDKKKLDAALERFMEFAHELRAPTKRYYDYFNSRGHGGYYFFFAHRNALEAADHASASVKKRTRALVRKAVRAAREGDGAFMDHYMNGRAYGTAQGLTLLAPRD